MKKSQKYKAPGRSHRQGLTFFELADLFPSETAAANWFEAIRWPDGEKDCPHCGSIGRVAEKKNRKPLPFRCLDCRKHFSVRTGTMLQKSKLPLRKWAIGIFLMSSSLKGVSSMRLHRELGITQKTAWMMAQKIRESFKTDDKLGGEVEIDEAYFGGKESNKHESKKLKQGRGGVGKTPVVAAKSRGGKVKAKPVSDTSARTLLEFADKAVLPGAKIYTDDNAAYRELPNIFNEFSHETVRHTAGEYVKGQAHVNGVESFWALLKRGYDGTFHHVSAKHLARYVAEFAGRHNIRDLDTIAQMAWIVRAMVGKKLPWEALTA